MPQKKYTYSLASDTLNGAIVNDQLRDEIHAEGSGVNISVDSITAMGDVLEIYMSDIMPDDIAGASASLLAVVALHDGTQIEIIQPLDSDNAPIVRAKAAPQGWTYQMHPIEFKTGIINSVINKDIHNADRGFAVIKFYKDVAGTDTLIEGADINQTFLDANCIRTDIDWEPTYDYEVLGGFISSYDTLTTDVFLWVIGVPDVPYASGGEKEMCGGVNMRYLDARAQLNVDGKVTKRMTYNAVYHTNKLRFSTRHDLGANINIQILIEHFKA